MDMVASPQARDLMASRESHRTQTGRRRIYTDEEGEPSRRTVVRLPTIVQRAGGAGPTIPVLCVRA